ncbi:hypothetical protein B7494_g5274 [Chlorociboria aeruginascens]|nr:hypothetical protein B7494_g5274 [Chlorociboria aeruginascens]
MPALRRTSIILNHQRPHLLRTFSTYGPPRQNQRSDFDGQGFTSTIEIRKEIVGPISKATSPGARIWTPSLLKQYTDRHVVGQDRARKVISVAIYNHYRRIAEERRVAEEKQMRIIREARANLRAMERENHPVENEYPGHVESANLNRDNILSEAPLGSHSLTDDPRTVIQKSNLLLLGPSGVGKTFSVEIVARILEVPFATVDCSSLTQAGYIGTDVESAIENLLFASNYSIPKCETGIILFDEVDKLAKPAVITHGRDVSGEGVQQGLLKMIEGTTITVNAKSDRNTGNSRNSIERGGKEAGGGMQGKSEQYTIDTSNILFIFAGAFTGLEKIIASRLSSGASIGFGAELRSSNSRAKSKNTNVLRHVLPTDLQTYGLIPELLGRIPIVTALDPLSLPQLTRILTEPKNSLVKQFTALLSSYGIRLRFSTLALEAIAKKAMELGKIREGEGGGIGARGLRSVMESVLAEIQFRGPGSGIHYVLIDEKYVQELGRESEADDGEEAAMEMPRCWSRGQEKVWEDAWEVEEEEWRRRNGRSEGVTFVQYRAISGSGM